MHWRKPLTGFFWSTGNNKSWNFLAEKNFRKQLICHFKEKKLMMIDCFCFYENFEKNDKIRRNFDRIRWFRLILFGNESPESDILLQKQRNFFGCQHRVHQSTIVFFSLFFCNRVGIGKLQLLQLDSIGCRYFHFSIGSCCYCCNLFDAEIESNCFFLTQGFLAIDQWSIL